LFKCAKEAKLTVVTGFSEDESGESCSLVVVIDTEVHSEGKYHEPPAELTRPATVLNSIRVPRGDDHSLVSSAMSSKKVCAQLTTIAAPYGASVAICALAPLKPFSEVKVGKKAERAAPVICWQMFMKTAANSQIGPNEMFF
jgi:hypothetical protein